MNKGLKDKIKKFYSWGLWTSSMVAIAVDKGVLTQEEADEILGIE